MKILGVDLGLSRTGLAISDPMELLASPIGTIAEKDEERLLAAIAQTAKGKGAEMIVVGYPRNMDGSCGESAKRAERLASELQSKTTLQTVLWDERMTTVSAIGFLNETNTRGKKRKAVVDTVAATIILQNFLDSRRS